MLVRVSVALFCVRDRGCGAHPVFPAPSDFRGQTKCKTPGASRRENAKSYLPAVIPGWSEGPDPEVRTSGFDAAHRPGM